ncbi:MAG: DUF4435 domain-containing protein [Prevotellaceae bacterium]|jgi:hypothetical protein|nr:DUF4435 domain-containing protein [Prevotellaceae bacterium]
MPAHNFYRKWARFYAGETALKKIDAVALVEGKTDKPFWGKIFHHTQNRVRIIAGSETKTQTGGKQECLKYYPFLTRRFFICIDSDYDYVLQSQPAHNVRRFVLQTYTYAIENHYLAANAELQEFLKQYAAIIYPAFLSHLATGSKMKEFNKEFNALISFADRRESSLEALQKNIRKKYPDALPLKPTTLIAGNAGLVPDNTYLFIPAKTLKHKLQCGDDLSFAHFPMNKIIDDISRLTAGQ